MKKIFNPLLSLLLATVCFINAFSQKDRPDIKFGNVKVSDFEPKFYPVDSSAGAVYLFDVGSSYFEGNSSGFFSVIYERHTRIRLLKRTSFDDIATVKVDLYKNEDFEQKIENLSAATYNLENGQIVTTKLDKKSIFTDKSGKWITVKFTFPNIKEGAVIEYSYKINSPSYRHLFPWYFQDRYPRLWTEYSVELPGLFDFAFRRQGYVPFTVDEQSEGHKNYSIVQRPSDPIGGSGTLTVSSATVKHTWAIKNIAPLKEESDITTLDNYIAKIEFQVAAVKIPEQPVDTIMQNWQQASKDLLKDDDFGKQLADDNNYLQDDIKTAIAGNTGNLAMAKAIYKFVRDNYVCTKYTGLYLSQPLKKTHLGKSGNVTDINMLLTAMLQKAGIDASPVILSTRSNGKANPDYPLVDKYNYTVVQANTGDTTWLLDATNKTLDFGRLPQRCYNGYAALVSEYSPMSINLSADSLKETKITTVLIRNEGEGLEGTYSSTLGNEASNYMRENITSGAKIDEYFKRIKKDYSFDAELSNMVIDSLKKLDCPVHVTYDFRFKPDNDIIYFTPFLDEVIKENPFASADRLYPVERPYCEDKIFILNMEIPKGYRADEVPKSAKAYLNGIDGLFEYLVSATAERIQLRCRLVIRKANFLPEDYQALRDFFTVVVKKEAEQIVFKKI